jgi:hypothetical protein
MVMNMIMLMDMVTLTIMNMAMVVYYVYDYGYGYAYTYHNEYDQTDYNQTKQTVGCYHLSYCFFSYGLLSAKKKPLILTMQKTVKHANFKRKYK